MTTYTGQKSVKVTLSTGAWVTWMVILAIAATLITYYGGNAGLIVLVWGIALTAMWRRGQQERTTLREAARLLNESCNLDAERRQALYSRLAGDMRSSAARRLP